MEAGAQPQPKGATVSKNGFLILGLSVLIMLWALPVWDAAAMLRDANTSYWLGSSALRWFIAVSALSLVAFYAATEATIGRWRHVPRTPQSLQSLSVMATLFVTVVGLLLILFAMPLQARSYKIYSDLTYECSYGSKTMRTSNAYKGLLALRTSAGCAGRFSVAQCEGFAMTPEARYLRDMEERFHCSGFCVEGSGPSALQLGSAAAPPDLWPASGAPSHGDEAGRPFLSGRSGPRKGGVAPTLARDSAGQAPGNRSASGTVSRSTNRTTASMLATTYAAPPTLFSQANYKFSCDTAAALGVRELALETAHQWWFIGLCLIGGSVFFGYWSWKPLAEA